jgi:hypothetical protein
VEGTAQRTAVVDAVLATADELGGNAVQVDDVVAALSHGFDGDRTLLEAPRIPVI